MKTIEELYGAFGQDVVNEVRQCMAKCGDIAPLLKRLNLPSAFTLVSQHEALRAFLFQYGIALFLKVIRSQMTPAEVETAKGEQLLSRLVGDTRARTVPQTAASPTASGASPVALPKKAQTNEAPNQSDPSGAPQQANERPLIVTPTYVGPDRRSGKDRRRNVSDRRLRVELIYRNRRFGGRDRRRYKRRAEDRYKS
ncbi:MAG: hypothetical protein ACPL7D_11645 [Candidatus Sumerlaeaceae bacterium]|jgi:hypothetical protein